MGPSLSKPTNRTKIGVTKRNLDCYTEREEILIDRATVKNPITQLKNKRFFRNILVTSVKYSAILILLS